MSVTTRLGGKKQMMLNEFCLNTGYQLRQRLDPFQLGKLIDQKLQRIYDLANRRLSPKVTAENRAALAKEKTLRGRRNGCGGSSVTFPMSRRLNPGLHL
jgi:hypothetical protein